MELTDIFYVVCDGYNGGLRWFWLVCGVFGVVCSGFRGVFFGGLGWFAVVCGGWR